MSKEDRSDEIRELLKQAKMSQAEFARLLKTQKNTVYRWCSGMPVPEYPFIILRMRIKLAEILELGK